MTEPPEVVSVDEQKRAAAHRAVEEYVRSGMVVGLGTGSTAIHATHRIGALLAAGELDGVVGVPTAIETADAARAAGIPLLGDDVLWSIDVTIDGADEVNPDLDLIKGGGGALLREKLVAQASAFEAIVADASKRSKVLGTSFALPVEVVDFGLATTIRGIERLGAEVVVRGGATPFRTDQGNLVLDCDFGPIADPRDLSAVLHAHAGVVEHGLFLGLTHALVVAGPDGVEVIAKD